MKKEEVIFDERYVGALTLTKVSKFYGDQNQVKALDNVSIQLFTGEFVVILGASGSGKSTLLNLIGGMDTVSLGSINIAGVDITQVSEKMFAEYRRRVVGFIFQFYNFFGGCHLFHSGFFLPVKNCEKKQKSDVPIDTPLANSRS